MFLPVVGHDGFASSIGESVACFETSSADATCHIGDTLVDIPGWIPSSNNRGFLNDGLHYGGFGKGVW